MSKSVEVDSSLSERPEHQRPRRLADWINPTGERKVHSLIDKVFASGYAVRRELGLVNLVGLIPSIEPRARASS